VAVYTPFAAGQKPTAADLGTLIVTELMPWTSLASLGSFASGFSANGTRVPEMRKIRIVGTEIWQFKGSFTVTTGTIAVETDVTAFTLTGSSNSVASEHQEMRAGTGHRYAVRVGWMTNGRITASVPTAAGTGTTGFWIDADIIDPLLAQ
jgi:hypothetical protein